MAIFTLTEIETQLTTWKAALLAVSAGKSFTVDGDTYTAAEEEQIRKTLVFLDHERSRLTGKRAGVLVSGRVAR
jgi:hypothetical protein